MRNPFGSGLFPLVLAGLLAGLSLWLDHYVRSQAEAPSGRHRHDPDMIASMAELERFDAQGRRIYLMRADRLSHFPDNDSTVAENVRLEHYGRPQVLYANAARSLMLRGGAEIQMSGGVSGRRDAGADSEASSFTTTELVVLPDEERAFTDQAVHMTRGRSTLDGIGMEIDQIEGSATLMQARARLYPKSSEAPSKEAKP